MHKCNNISHDFLKSWMSGWPDYTLMIERDSEPVLEIAQQCARRLQVDLDEGTGFNRVLMAIRKIAEWCGKDKDWRSENLYSINQAIQTIMQKMIAGKKSQEEADYEQRSAQRAYELSKTERGKAEKAMEEENKRLKEEYDTNWSEDDQKGYEAYMRRITPGRVISIDLAQEKHINKAL